MTHMPSGPWQRAARGAMLLGEDGSLAPTIFTELSMLADATGALNLGQGFPDEDGPEEVLEAAREAISNGVNQYTPGIGMAVLREAIARHQKRFYDIDLDPAREVLVTAGATEALTSAILAFVEPGDDVVVFEPFYDSYAATIALAGARQVDVPLRAPDFQPDLDRLRDAVTDRTRMIIVNSPHNPTGSVLTREAMELIVDLATRHDALILTDEVYEHLIFDGIAHTPIATLPGARERTISVSSAGKTFSVTGWKIGWLTAPPELTAAALSIKQWLSYVNGAPFQPAIARGLDLPDEFYHRIADELQAKRDLMIEGLTAAGLTVSRPQGSYFVIADAAPLGATDALDFCRSLPERAGVVGIPLTAFVRPERREGYRSLVRFAFCKRREVLEEAVRRLAALR